MRNMMEDKRIQDEDKYNKIMNQIKNESFKKSEGLRFHEPEHESSRRMR